MAKNIYQGYSLNMAFNSGACTAAGAAATLTVVTAVDAIVKGKWATQVAAEAKTLAFVTAQNVPADSTTGYATASAPVLYGGASTNANAPADNEGQAIVLVHCTDAAGATKTVAGPVVQLDESGDFLKAASFPAIPDTLTPYCYHVVEAGKTSGDVTIGTTNWNATGVVSTIHNVAVLPQRPVTA
jgi:hypothetical protein